MHDTQQSREEWNAWMSATIEQSMKLEQRFAALFGNSKEAAKARRARELMIDGDLAAIPVPHRLAVVRQLFLIMWEHDLLEVDRDDCDSHLRAVAARVGLPYLEVFNAWEAGMRNPDVTRDDLDDWVAWCREHAPSRLEQAEAAQKMATRPRRKKGGRR